tara:strand:+ start:180 stop:710 length:531 start_codon:yes stop_codon:yes gene_type:complete
MANTAKKPTPAPAPAPAQTFGLAQMQAAMQAWHVANPKHAAAGSTHLNGARYANCGNLPLNAGLVLQEWVAANGGWGAVTFKATGQPAKFGAASVGNRAKAQAAFGSPSNAGFTNAAYLTWCKTHGASPALLQSVKNFIGTGTKGQPGTKLGTAMAEIVAAMYYSNAASIELVAAK